MRILAIILAVTLAAPAARAADDTPAATPPVVIGPPTYNAPAPAPKVYVQLDWLSPSGERSEGFWYTAAQVQRINLRLEYLENKCTTECVTATNAATKADLGSFKGLWITGAIALAAGVAAGFLIARKVK